MLVADVDGVEGDANLEIETVGAQVRTGVANAMVNVCDVEAAENFSFCAAYAVTVQVPEVSNVSNGADAVVIEHPAPAVVTA